MNVSIITAVLNRAHCVTDAIDSVQKQSYPNIEHIIIDGDSTDGTAELVKTYCDPSTKILSEKDTGVYDAINKGIKVATSEIIGCLHSDDFFANAHVLEKVMGAFASDTTIDAVYGDIMIQNKSMNHVIRYWRPGTFRNSQLKMGWIPPHTALFVRRSVFETYGLYNPTFRVSGDYDFMLRILMTGNLNLYYIPEVLVHMRSGGLSSQRYFATMKEDYRALKMNGVGGVFTLYLKYLRVFKQYYYAIRMRS